MLISIQNEDVRYHIYGRSHERVMSTTTQHAPPLLQVSAEAPRQPVSPTDCKSQRDKRQHGKLKPTCHTCHPRVAEGTWEPLPAAHLPACLTKAFGTVPWASLARPWCSTTRPHCLHTVRLTAPPAMAELSAAVTQTCHPKKTSGTSVKKREATAPRATRSLSVP